MRRSSREKGQFPETVFFFTVQHVEDIFPCQEIYCTVLIFYIIMKNDKYFQELSSAVRVERYRDGQITGPIKR